MTDYASKHNSKKDLDELREQHPEVVKYPGGRCIVCGVKCPQIVSECEACFRNQQGKRK